MRHLRRSALLCALSAVLGLCAPAAAQVARPFAWLDGTTVSITTGNTSLAVPLQGEPSGVFQIRLYSNCPTPVFIRRGGDGSVTATSADLPIAPGSIEMLTITNPPNSPTAYLAMISPSGSCTVYFTVGAGF